MKEQQKSIHLLYNQLHYGAIVLQLMSVNCLNRQLEPKKGARLTPNNCQNTGIFV